MAAYSPSNLRPSEPFSLFRCRWQRNGSALTETLHRSADLEVRRVVAGDGREQVVTFESYHDDVGFARAGFGEAFFAGEGITAIHVLCRSNDWFQYAEMAAVLALIREAAAPAERLLAYGSSMGGYAAARFAGAIGAQAALALSPQYSVDRRRMRFERRWPHDQRRIRFRRELEGTIDPCPGLVVAYDPTLAHDRRHAERIEREAGATLLPLPYSGHPCGPLLAELGLLRPLVRDLLAGQFDAEALLAAFEQGRRGSATWLSAVAALQPRRRGAYALRLAEGAVARAPGNAPILYQLALRHQAAGNVRKAAVLHEQVIATHPHPIFHWQLAKALLAVGDLSGAEDAIGRAREATPHVAAYHRTAAAIFLARGDRLAAREAFRRARGANGAWGWLAAPWHGMIASFRRPLGMGAPA